MPPRRARGFIQCFLKLASFQMQYQKLPNGNDSVLVSLFRKVLLDINSVNFTKTSNKYTKQAVYVSGEGGTTGPA